MWSKILWVDLGPMKNFKFYPNKETDTSFCFGPSNIHLVIEPTVFEFRYCRKFSAMCIILQLDLLSSETFQELHNTLHPSPKCCSFYISPSFWPKLKCISIFSYWGYIPILNFILPPPSIPLNPVPASWGWGG